MAELSPQPAPRIPVRTMAQDLEHAVRARQGQTQKPAPTKQTKEPERITLRSLEAQEEDVLAPYRQKKSSLQKKLEESGQVVTPPFGITRIMPRPSGLPSRSSQGAKREGEGGALPYSAGYSSAPSSTPAPPLPSFIPLQPEKNAPEKRREIIDSAPSLTPPPQKRGGEEGSRTAPLPPPIPPRPVSGETTAGKLSVAPTESHSEGGQRTPFLNPTFAPLSQETSEERIEVPAGSPAGLPQDKTKEQSPAMDRMPAMPPLPKINLSPRVPLSPPPIPKTPESRGQPAQKFFGMPTNIDGMRERHKKLSAFAPGLPQDSSLLEASKERQAEKASVEKNKELPGASKKITPHPLPIEEEEMEVFAIEKPSPSIRSQEISATSPESPEPASMPQIPQAPGAQPFLADVKPFKDEMEEEAPYRPLQTPGPRPSLQEEIAVALKQMLAKQTPASPTPTSPQTPEFQEPKPFAEKPSIEIRPPVQTPEEILGLRGRRSIGEGESPSMTADKLGERGYDVDTAPSQEAQKPVTPPLPWSTPNEPLGRAPQVPMQEKTLRGPSMPTGFGMPASLPSQTIEATPQTPPSGAEGPFEPSLSVEPSGNKLQALLRVGLFILGVTIILGSVGGVVYWQVFRQEEPSPPTPPPQQEPPAPRTPTPFFSVSWQQTVQIAPDQEQALRQLLVQASEQAHPAETIGFLRLQKSTGEFLTSRAFLEAMGIALPDVLANSFDENQFMLYMYIPGEEEGLRCQASNIADPGCSSARLGVIFKLRANREERVQTELESFQGQLAQAALPLILGSPALPAPYEWEATTYRGIRISYPAGIAVQYVNLPLSTTALNYAIVKGYLVMGTSKNSIYAALDELLRVVDPGGIE